MLHDWALQLCRDSTGESSVAKPSSWWVVVVGSVRDNAIASMQKSQREKVARKYPPDQHRLHKTASYKKLRLPMASHGPPWPAERDDVAWLDARSETLIFTFYLIPYLYILPYMLPYILPYILSYIFSYTLSPHYILRIQLMIWKKLLVRVTLGYFFAFFVSGVFLGCFWVVFLFFEKPI